MKDNTHLTDSSEIIVRSLKQPTVTNVGVENGVVKLDVEKELGVEVVGNTKLKVPVEDDEDEYEELFDEPEMEEIREDYLS